VGGCCPHQRDGACAIEIERAARQVSGFSEFTVNPASHLARWVAAAPGAIDELVLKAKKLGYALGLQDAESSDIQAQRNRRAARSRFLRFVVAALCMMQIMMYSTPKYIFPAEEIGFAETGLLRWAQWVLALSLVLYCAAPFYKHAWLATVQGRLVMDQPIALGIFLAFVLSSLNLNQPAEHVWFDSIAMLLALLLLVQMLLENQTARALNHLARLQPDLPMKVDVPDIHGWKPMPVGKLQPAQLYRLMKSQAVPVDSELVSNEFTVWVDEAMRTGEADPVLKNQGDLIQAGSRVLSDHVVLRSTANEHGDGLLALGKLLLQALASKPGHQDKVERILPWFVFAVLLCAAGTAFYWGVLQSQLQLASTASVAVLIVTCPCALALALPLVRLFGIRRLAQAGVLVRNPQALDTLRKVDVVAMDKTGTLTSQHAVQVNQHAVLNHAAIQSPQILNALYLLACRSGHPLSKAVASHLFAQLNPNAQAVQCLSCAEIPGAGLTGVFMLNNQLLELRLGSAAHCDLPVQQCSASQVFAVCIAANGMAIIRQALMFEVCLQGDHELKAQFDALHSQGLSLNMLSGDTLQAVEQWMPELRFNARVGGMSPADKINWITRQQAAGHVLAMVGDGLNDSGAFAKADVSFAAAGASTLSAGQADFLMLKPGMAGLLAALNTARKIDSIGRQNLLWALAYNGIAVPVAMMGFLSPWMASLGMGLSSLLVFLNALRINRSH
jgi:P-type Cu2+ transporter